ncbi:hypothetical protein [Thermofilum pendens]|uniref:Uncharacterized protein n=1 Tax=Thermofilum pendens (strain DSM 2475 / Hrk 5) TaxID=368408 RepID=A1RZW2_THEPD|nr:hypothetical protein [Thermofilum pendens]ABL78742.1 hypothetical protein Tpen_1345 [Thermofilum pendens Hrk 5]
MWRVVEEALRKAVEEEKLRRVEEALRGFAESMGDLPVEEWVEVVKASRRGRIPGAR